MLSTVSPTRKHSDDETKFYEFRAEKEFIVGKHLEIEMEFKTSELSGILISIAEPPFGSPSLSIEVFNGKVSF